MKAKTPSVSSSSAGAGAASGAATRGGINELGGWDRTQVIAAEGGPAGEPMRQLRGEATGRVIALIQSDAG